jgi:hypothetical membrane protein
VAKASGALLAGAGAAILMGIITAEALFPAAYSTSQNTISDLGSTWQPGGIVREPSATIFNTTLLLTGAMIVAAGVLLYRASGRRAVSIAVVLLGLGVLGVGVFPGTEVNGEPSTTGAHPLVSMLAFISGAFAALLTSRITTAPFRYVSAVLGLASLLSLVLSSPLGSTSLGDGGIERWVAYPTVLWLVAFGGYAMAGGPIRPTRRGGAGLRLSQ